MFKIFNTFLIYDDYIDIVEMTINKERFKNDIRTRINKYLELTHKGWKKNYIYWVNNEPYETSLYKITNNINNKIKCSNFI